KESSVDHKCPSTESGNQYELRPGTDHSQVVEDDEDWSDEQLNHSHKNEIGDHLSQEETVWWRGRQAQSVKNSVVQFSCPTLVERDDCCEQQRNPCDSP